MTGTRKHHPRPFTEAELVAIRSAMLALLEETTWTQAKLAQAVADFDGATELRHVDKRDFQYGEFAMANSTISRWKARITNISQWHAWAICLWMREKFPERINDALRRASLDYKEPFAFLFNEMTGSQIDFHGLATLRGDYRLYRPCFHKPDSQLLASLFSVGGSGSDFDCTMRTKHPAQISGQQDEIVRGKIVPENRTMMCVLTAPKSRSTFVIHFHEIERDNDDVGAVRYMIGVMLAASGGFPSTAWPVFAQRLSPKDTPAAKIIPAKQFLRLDPMIQEALSRGIVHSDQRLYPGLPFPVSHGAAPTPVKAKATKPRSRTTSGN